MSAPTDPSPGSRDRAPGPRRSTVRSGVDEGGTPPPPRRRLALVGRLGLVVVLLLAVVATVVVVSQRHQFGRQDAGAEEIPALEVAPAPVQLGTVAQPDALAPPTSLVPGGAPSQAPAGGARTVSGWATDIASRVDVPARALQAYGQADLAVKQEQPDCNLSWVTVAGLARIESNHGRYRGASIAENGDVTPRVIGVPLDGTGGNRTIGDTDGGVLDGDTALDRAVGPLQFIPSTWAKWRSDGNGDGVADPNNIFDAALAAGRYLCAGGRDLATGPGWRAAVLSYNNSDEYGRRVYAAADSYASASQA
ncbi:lytic transglycosylase domain-containing protein [Actinomycetospora callitridis]|uniref:lytic transglycosylase domain-containing protein n=1 Tax=Actinomycetospora callitridis TaxID=913944 RepID=UPI002366ED91|nr:murein transglycosylase [Actinomycetospora callitridis]MDD7917517.1 murein transglycosylase [Actinomycetospora callitridis]